MTEVEQAQQERVRPDRRAWWAVLLLAVALVPFVQELSAQPAIRYAQTAALVDQGSFRLDDYRDVVGVDRVEFEGHLYGDKAPLQPLLSVPVYASARLAGAEPATVPRVEGNLGLWWVTVWATVVPLLTVAWLGVRTASRLVDRRRALLGSLAVCGGTLLVAYGTQLYAHVLAGLLGWAAWLLVAREGAPARAALAAGVLGGAAVATEYPMVLVVAAVGGFLVWRRDWRRVALFVAGGVPAVLLLAWYHWAAFGSPFTVPYNEKPQHAAESLVVGVPDPLQLVEVLLGSRGLLVFSPVVAVAVVGLVHLARGAGAERRRHGVMGLVVLAAFLVLQSAWSNPWGGESPGPRYVIPALPFLIVGMADVWDRAGRARWLAVRWSVLAMASTVVAVHLIGGDQLTVAGHLRNLEEYGPVETLWTLALGPAGWVLHVATVAAVVVALARRVPGSGPEPAAP